MSVTYNPDNEDQFLQNTTYYINNKGTGKYLRYYSGSVSGQSGTLYALGKSIQWELQGVADGYVIRAKNDTTKYLAAHTNIASNAVEVVTVSQSAIPGRCVWRLVPGGAGYQLQSVYSLRFLYSSGSNMYTSASVPSSSSTNYLSYFWRAVTTSQYGNTSSHVIRELSGASFATLILNAGDSKAPSITKTPSNAVWAEASDFTYIGYSSSYLWNDGKTGEFSGYSYFVPAHSTTVLAIHKVTGLSATFTLKVSRKAVLVGIPDTLQNHDHTSALSTLQSNITNHNYYGYNDVIFHNGEISVAALNAYLDDAANNLFISRSHGDTDPEDGTQIGTYIRLNDIELTDGEDNPVKYSSTGSITSLNLSNMQLMMFVGCHTGAGGENGLNLPTVAVNRGARTAVGFKDTIPCVRVNEWLIAFFNLLNSGYSVDSACQLLAESNYYTTTNLKD